MTASSRRRVSGAAAVPVAAIIAGPHKTVVKIDCEVYDMPCRVRARIAGATAAREMRVAAAVDTKLAGAPQCVARCREPEPPAIEIRNVRKLNEPLAGRMRYGCADALVARPRTRCCGMVGIRGRDVRGAIACVPDCVGHAILTSRSRQT